MSPTIPIVDLQAAIESTNTLAVPDKQANELIAVLKPVAARIESHERYAAGLVIKTDAQATEAAAIRDTILADNELAKTAIESFGDKLIERLFKLHRGWTAGRARFTGPLESAAKQIKQKIGDFEFAKEKAAEAERARLQAEADAKARKEQERLEAKAASMKTPEKQEQYREQAQAVVAPVIAIPVTKTGVKYQERLAVMKCDLIEMGVPKEIAGYFKVELHPDGRFRQAVLSAEKLCAAKSANSMLEIKGVEFKKIRC